MHSADDVGMCLGDFDGHIGILIDLIGFMVGMGNFALYLGGEQLMLC